MRDGKLSSEEYIDVFIQAIKNEESDEIITNQFYYVAIALQTFTPRKFRDTLARRLFDFGVTYLLNLSEKYENRKIMVKDNIVKFARDEDSLRQLVQWYEGTHEKLKAYNLGVDNQWYQRKNITIFFIALALSV